MTLFDILFKIFNAFMPEETAEALTIALLLISPLLIGTALLVYIF